jgi:hypothetical protein
MERTHIEGQFGEAAEYLLGNCIIRCDSAEYQITELEFYYYSEIHPDPFVHRHDNQLRMGVWYFHDVGQDLTFGDGKNHGGILVRGIKSLDNGEFADGPVKVYDKLFNEKHLSINAQHCFGICESENRLIDTDHEIYSFPRVGLQPTQEKQGIDFFIAPYRYISCPEVSAKDRNVIYFYLKYIYSLEKIPEEITRDSATIRYYERLFEQGITMSLDEYQKLINGEEKMSVTNKCKLLGYHFKDRLMAN